ncbi:MAG: DUF3828 domain-containing protein [Xanthobacteraceae bacterium]
MQTRRGILIDVVVGVIAARLIDPALAAEQTAKDFLDAIYATYVGKDAQGMPLDQPATRRLFSPGLLKLVDDDAKRAKKRGEVPNLDGDPFVDAQEWEINSFTVDLQDGAPGKAKAIVKFKNFDKDVAVALDLVQLQGGWRIDEIAGPSGSLRALLKQK